MKYFSLGDTSVYNKDVTTLLRLSLKSAIIIESKSKLPIVYLFFRFSIFFSLFESSDFSSLDISSYRFCFVEENCEEIWSEGLWSC